MWVYAWGWERGMERMIIIRSCNMDENCPTHQIEYQILHVQCHPPGSMWTETNAVLSHYYEL